MSEAKREALASLLDHPGWAIFVDMVQREWGDAGKRFESELDRLAEADDDMVEDALELVEVVTDGEALVVLVGVGLGEGHTAHSAADGV